MEDNNATRAASSEKVHCTAFCPVCGSDIAYLGNECICKNKDCSWHCGGCRSEEDNDFAK